MRRGFSRVLMTVLLALVVLPSTGCRRSRNGYSFTDFGFDLGFDSFPSFGFDPGGYYYEEESTYFESDYYDDGFYGGGYDEFYGDFYYDEGGRRKRRG